MRRLIIVFAALLIVAYGFFEARRLIEGPIITITSPQDGSATSTTLLTVSGVASNISFLTVDDKPAFTDTSGHFSVTLSPPAGIAIITLAALDRFGRRARKEVSMEVLDYCPVRV